MEKIINIAIVGCGGIGRRRSAAVGTIDSLRLVVCADVDRVAAEQAAAIGHCEAVTEWESAVERDDVDLVIVSTPNFLHAPVSIAAANAGKHVLCEKPLARNPEEAQEMVAAANANDVQLRTGFNHRFDPQVAKAKQLFESGAIGQPTFIRARTGHGGSERLITSWFVDKERSGGGTFLDNGVHAFDLCRFFLGDFVEATGFCTTNVWPIEVEDNGFGVFRTADGHIASLHSSWTQWQGYLFMEIFGTDGSISLNYSPRETILHKHAQGGKSSVMPNELHTEQFQFPGEAGSSWEIELAEVLKAIAGEPSQSADGVDGLRAVEMAYGVYESNSTGKTIKL
ncbi:Gfo/Idh/MocA family oxidoreductase [Chloroflexi bacterium TSY]|nr:Gfo/Idh/MocA family oxidoreductase [Chloroflexi bacterium TSY]